MPTYRAAPDHVCRLADQIQRKYHRDLADAHVTCAYLFAHALRNERTGDPEGPAIKHHGWPAKALIRVNNARDRVAGLPDVTILLDGDEWEGWSGAEQIAVLDHEWEHAELILVDQVVVRDDAGRPRVRLRPHDFQIGGFDAIVERHGHAATEAADLCHVRERWVQKDLQFEDVPATV